MTKLVTDNPSLRQICERASRRAFIILDTEFVRTRTLTPNLGLIQLNDGEQVWLIDPIAITDFTPLVDLLVLPSCTKVLHACSEDLEAFHTALGVTPAPLFDTQFAAQLCGIGTTMGYANLVETLLGIELDKGESRTDWMARPLSDKQLSYAANDVIHLLPVYQLIMQKLSEEQVSIVLSESEQLSKKKIAKLPSEFAYLLVKNNWKLSGSQLLALQRLAKWRLDRARDKNMALNFVLKEPNLVAIAMAMPTSKTALSKIPSITPQEVRIAGNALIKIVAQAIADAQATPEVIPEPVTRLSELRRYKPTMAALKTLVQDIASETGIPAEILSSKKQLHQVLQYYWFNQDEYRAQGLEPDLLCGWREPLFRHRLSDIIN